MHDNPYNGNFRLKLQNSPELPHSHVVMQMRKVNREKGYLTTKRSKNWRNAGGKVFTDLISLLYMYGD